MSEADFELILARLAAADVRFVLIGGLALGSRGVIRGTKGVDIVPERSPENLERLAEAATDLGGHVEAEGGFFSSAFSIAAQLADDRRVLIETPHGPLDVVGGLPGVPSFEELIAAADYAEISGHRVAISSVEDLRRMKKAAGRAQDLADLESLDALGGEDGSV